MFEAPARESRYPAASMRRVALAVGLLAAFSTWGQVLGSPEVHLKVGQEVRLDVKRAVGLNCDDLGIVDAKLVTSKDKTHNSLVLKGKAEGKTYCRAGQAAVGGTFLVHIVVEEPD
jgi:hypothetical protein